MTNARLRVRYPRRFLAALFLVGQAIAAEPPESAETDARIVGADRDEHGCIATAGYVWCAREAKCVRPWELAEERGLEPGEAAFADYCDPPAR
jgi:hypothetical protein